LGDRNHNADRQTLGISVGGLTITHHPFSTRFGTGDVRITTHVSENDLGDVLFSTLHEAGHAMYEQGVRATLDGTTLEKVSRRVSMKASRASGRT
jgi:Zn-dependent M32 family carboxypeptidase